MSQRRGSRSRPTLLLSGRDDFFSGIFSDLICWARVRTKGVSVSDMVWVLRFGKMFMDVAGVRAIVVVDPIVIRP